MTPAPRDEVAQRSHLIWCGRLVDGTGAPARDDVVVRVRRGRIVDVVDGPEAGAAWQEPPVPLQQRLDLSGHTVLPGLIDCHDHVGLDLGDVGSQVAEGEAVLSLRAARTCAAAREAGITTLRDMGEWRDLAMVWRDAVASGLLAGPRLLVAGTWITRTGGHVWMAGREADGPQEIARAVREQARAGADWIKLSITGGILTPRSDPVAPGYTAVEIEAAVEAAHFVGLPVTAHIHGGQGLRDAVIAGIDCIEHGTFAGREDFALMRERDIPLVSTFGVLDVGAASEALSDEARAKMRRARAAALKSLVAARETGLSVAVGTDLNHADMARELEALVAAGFTPMQALCAATRNGAQVLRLEDVGVVAPGKTADLIAVPPGVLEDVRLVADVRFVMQGGVVVRDVRDEQRPEERSEIRRRDA